MCFKKKQKIINKYNQANIREQTAFVELLTVKAEALVHNENYAQYKEYTKKVYEALRYSDPLSAAELSEVENRIATYFDGFFGAIKTVSEEDIKFYCNELISALTERNRLCQRYK